MKKKLWLLVTFDEYELPLFVADSASELGRHVGLSANAIISAVSKAKHKGFRSRYHSVEIEDDEDPPV
jgi:ribosomal protein L7Ae-like RNA K-turn-binding protein